MMIKRVLRKIYLSIVTPIYMMLPLKKIILFESYPDYSDNTKYVFQEMINRNINSDYKLIWIIHNYKEFEKLQIKREKNVFFVNINSIIKKNKLFCTAKAFISCNNFLRKMRESQYYIHLCHGAALKNCSSYTSLLDYIDDVVTFSPYLAKYDAKNFCCTVDKMVELGYPRNDELFGNKIDIHPLFPNCKFVKSIYWLPTFRQNEFLGDLSNVSIPIIYNEQIAQEVNDYAIKQQVLIIIKPHFAQDVSKIKILNLSNLVFIDNDFLCKNGIENYELLRSVNAMISDYSSVYYDYLLTDRPIGLCFDDFDAYNKNQGFTVDPNFILSGGEKLYNSTDLCDFINNVANEIDILKEERHKICKLIHSNTDNNATKRVTDYIISKISD